MTLGRDVAAVLVGHGDRGGPNPNARLRAHAEIVQSLTGLRSVVAGVLKGTPSLEDALDVAQSSNASELLVCPLFMANGYFAQRVLPKRLSAAQIAMPARTLPPLGLDPGLAELMIEDAAETAQASGHGPAETHLLVVGHGSKFGPASARATTRAAERAAARGIFLSVTTAFLEEAPFLSERLQRARAPTVVAGYFFGKGMHASEDVPNAIAKTGAPAVYSGSVGSSARIPHLVAAAIERALSDRG